MYDLSIFIVSPSARRFAPAQKDGCHPPSLCFLCLFDDLIYIVAQTRHKDSLCHCRKYGHRRLLAGAHLTGSQHPDGAQYDAHAAENQRNILILYSLCLFQSHAKEVQDNSYNDQFRFYIIHNLFHI
nr:MAG TPA: hypothetical protein [Caudoviricetes sp.]